MFDGDLLAERARITPDREALVYVPTGERFTYAQLDARANGAAEHLRSLGLQPGDRFGIHGPNCVEYLDLFFAAGRVGAIVVPLSTRATGHELDAIKIDCDMKLVVECGGSPPPWRPMKGGNPAHSDEESIYCLLYTSGTTGKPKGVMIPRRQLWWNGYNTAINWGLREDDVSPVFTPLYHAGGLAAFLIPIFTAGGRIVLHNRFDTTEVWNTIERERCTVVLGVPTIWKMLMDAPEFATVNLDRVRWFISGGAPLPTCVIDAYEQRGITMRQGYGMTEAGVNCFTMTSEEAARKKGSIGRPMMFTDVRIAGVEEIGEMLIRGPHVSKGYWNNDAATRDAYDEDGWLHTGDLARRDADGFFYVAGRAKDMFISGGVNVYPAEIEAELVSHPLVADAAVVPIDDATWGEVGVAFVVCKDGLQPVAELEQHLSARLSRYKLPKRYVFLDALPRTPYGKIEKGKLRDQLS